MTENNKMNFEASAEAIEGKLENFAEVADRRVAEFEQVVSRVIDRVESIGQTVNRIFARGKEQKEHLMELKDKATSTLSPIVEQVTPAVTATRDASRHLASSAKANPKPFLVGGALVAGGLLLVAYYMRKHESGSFFTEGFEQPETWRTENSSEFVQSDVANAS
ncbi:MAG: hypothetical protein EOP11_02635 [Proteobacteria bacterium]|nr:MAG: hypothetical protein EOP11_02635 [Pseudomonadota bacterium]